MLIHFRRFQLKHWILAARPKTLAAAFVPVLVATALSVFYLKPLGNQIHYRYSFFALISAIFIQIGTNLVNDALDFKKGADTPSRLGPIRVTQNGLLTPKQVLAGGLFCFVMAGLFGAPLVQHAGLPILCLGLLSVLCGYIYTGGPYPLAYVGLGDIFVVLFFGLGAVCGVFYIHTGLISTGALVASLQIGCLATVLIAINNFRDYASDRLVNKLTLAARFGQKFARYEICALYAIPFVLNLYWITHGPVLAGVLPLATLPLTVTVATSALQVFYKKVLKRKLFRIAPIHHHFEAIGWPAYKVTMRYWVITIIAGIFGIALALLK